MELLGFVNGMKGLMNGELMKIEEQTYKGFRNLGGFDYLGKAEDALRSEEQHAKALEMCEKF